MSCYGYRKLSTMQGAKEFYEDKIDEYSTYVEDKWGEYIENSINEFAETINPEIAPLFKPVIKKYLDAYGGEYEATELADYLENVANMLEDADSPYIAGDFRNFAEFLPDFEVKDEDEWLTDEYEGELGAMADACYEEYRDRQMGL